MKKRTFLLLISVIFFTACIDNKKVEITTLVNEWQGKEIRFPKNPIFTRLATDTTDYTIPDGSYKMLIYVDSTGCTGCKLKLSQWSELMAQIDSISGGEVIFLFFLHPQDVEEIHYLFLVENFDHSVCIDVGDELNRLNQFPSDNIFQTFLLDKDNKVIMIGNPVYNTAIKGLYIKYIRNSIAIVQH